MATPSYVTRSITVRGADGNHVTVSETAEHQEVVLTIQQNGEGGRLATVRLDYQQFEALCQTKYDLEVASPTADAPEGA